MLKIQILISVILLIVGIIMMITGFQSGNPGGSEVGYGGIMAAVGFLWFVILSIFS